MEEDIKKDLEEIKEDVEKSEEKEEKDISSEQEEDLSEKKEEPVEEPKKEKEKEKEEGEEELKEEVKEEEIVPHKKERRFLNYLLIGGIIVCLGLTLIGFWIGFKLIKGKQEKKQVLKPSNQSVEIQKKEKIPPVKKIFKIKHPTKLILSKTQGNTASYPYKFELKNFFIPLDFKTFLNVDAVLYFDNSATMRKIVANEVEYREILYEYLQKIPVKVWYNPEQKKQVEKSLQKVFEKKGISPTPKKIELDGVIYKA